MSENSEGKTERSGAKVPPAVGQSIAAAKGFADGWIRRASQATGIPEKSLRTGLLVGAGVFVGLLLRRRSRS